MHARLWNTALMAALASASPLAAPEPTIQNGTELRSRQVSETKLYAVYNTNKWETNISPGVGASDGGEEISLSNGFNIVTDSGALLYSTSDLDGYALCAQQGRQFELSGGCFVVPYRFSCSPDASGDTGSCAVWGPDLDGEPNVEEDCESADSGPSYTVFSAGTSGNCVVGFTVDGDCNPERAMEEWYVERTTDDAPPSCDPCPWCS